MRKIEVPTEGVPEFEPEGRCGRYTAEEGGREAREREEEAQRRERSERRRLGGWELHKRQRREWQKSMQGQKKVTQNEYMHRG